MSDFAPLDREALLGRDRLRRVLFGSGGSGLHRTRASEGRPSGRHRLARPTEWVARGPVVALRLSVIFVTLCVTLAYGGGITYGHWITAALAEVEMTTGSLDVVIEDPGAVFDPDCDTHWFPRHAVSFVRFWPPGEEAGDLKPSKPGAVKILDGGNRVSPGFTIEPPDATLGDPVMIYLGTTTVTVTDWIGKPGDPGKYLGFRYILEGDPVVVDVKAAQSIWRTVLDQSGLWSLDGMDEPEARPIDFCGPLALEATIPVTNDGSVPATPYIALGPATDCEPFAATLTGPDGVMASGPLCDLLDSPYLVIPQLDPGETTFVTLSIGVLDEELGPGEHPGDLVVGSFATQWNLALEDAHLGWTSSSGVLLDLTISIDPPPDPDDCEEEDCDEDDEKKDKKGEDESSVASVPSAVEEPAVEEPAVGEPAVGEPAVGEPAVEESAVGEPAVEESAVGEPAVGEPAVEEPAIEEPTTASLAGFVWHDLLEDGMAVQGDFGVGGVTVVLVDTDGFAVETTETLPDGSYLFPSIEPGTFRVRFIPPEGFGFADPEILIEFLEDFETAEDFETFLAEQAEEWEVGIEDIVISDLEGLDERGTPTIGFIAEITLAGGENRDIADAALIEVVEEEDVPEGPPPHSNDRGRPADQPEESDSAEPTPEPSVVESPAEPGDEPPATESIEEPEGQAPPAELIEPAGADGHAKEPEPDPVDVAVGPDAPPADDESPADGEISEVPPEEVPVGEETTP